MATTGSLLYYPSASRSHPSGNPVHHAPRLFTPQRHKQKDASTATHATMYLHGALQSLAMAIRHAVSWA